MSDRTVLIGIGGLVLLLIVWLSINQEHTKSQIEALKKKFEEG